MERKPVVSDRAVQPERDPDLAYIEHDFERALNGDTPLVAASFEELERLAKARGLGWFVPRIRKRDYRFIRRVVLETFKRYAAEDNFRLLHPDSE